MRPLITFLLIAASCAFAQTSPITTTPVGPNEVRVQRMDMGKASLTSISMTSFQEATTIFQDEKAPSMRTLSVTLADNDKEKIERTICIVGDTPGLSIVTTNPHGTQEYRMTVFEPSGTLRGSVLRKFHSGKMEETLFDAEGKPAPPDQRSRIMGMKMPDPIDLAKVTLLKMPADGDTPAASPPPPGPNEIRVEYYAYGDLILQAIYTPDLRQESFFAKDSKALEFRTVTATLSDTDAERVTQSFLIKKNTISGDQSWRLNKKTNEVTESCYTPKGKPVYTRHTILGKSETIVDGAGNTITRNQAARLLESPNPDQIDLDKVPVQDMTGKAPAATPTPPAE